MSPSVSILVYRNGSSTASIRFPYSKERVVQIRKAVGNVGLQRRMRCLWSCLHTILYPLCTSYAVRDAIAIFQTQGQKEGSLKIRPSHHHQDRISCRCC
jgi:hypothetical protein